MTSVDPLRQYVEARKKKERLERELDYLAQFFSELSRVLSQKAVVAILNASWYKIPPELENSESVIEVDAETWPDITKVGGVLMAYYQAEKDFRQAQARLPEEERLMFRQEQPQRFTKAIS